MDRGHLPGVIETARTRGFLDPLDAPISLSHPYDHVHVLALNAASLLSEGRLGGEVEKLPIIFGLPAEDELSRAKVALSFLVQAYVWETAQNGESGARESVPEQLSAPLMAVSSALDEPPAYLYVDHTLRNTRLIDPTSGVGINNLKSVYTFSGTPDEDQFVVVHTSYDAIGIRAVKTAIDLASGALAGEEENGMYQISQTIHDMRCEFLKVKSIVSPDVFREKIRLFLMGWHGNVQKLRFENSDIDPRRLRGETGAGSALLPFLDRFASIMTLESMEQAKKENDPIYDSIKTYFDFDKYRPKWHRDLLLWMEGSTIRDMAKNSFSLRKAYNKIVMEVLEMRKAHLNAVGAYLRGNNHPLMSRGIGTGGSPYNVYLADLMRVTERALL